ncbi:sugar transferase [Siphonobacter sp. BAB-5405]|uniref:sugar transferase n=1 Tax=Siphonobacter sp. BAB-5405 TaxID=1864825 RepID=UPI000C8003FB|nr:sugar transferase [Siphonobacter sp. BAB-5405]PMD90713.1 sugar transferase [Siphonobacter sp. BAB-5405]
MEITEDVLRITYSQTTEPSKKVRKPIAGKRVFDVCMASLVTVLVLFWMIPLIGVLIKLSSPGPIFFVQWRTGRRGKPFRCFKFRTMKYVKDSSFKQATRNDPRITPIGQFLRKTNLDEMPQFLNVILGDMSIVGPRPHALEHDAEYWTIVPNFSHRYLVRPGITGLAQTRGLRGEVGLREMKNRLRMDQWYIRKRSTVLDVKICWWTVEKMIKGDKKAW